MRGYKFFCEMCLLVALSAIVLISGCGSSSSSDSPSPPDTTAPTAPTFVTAVAASDKRVSIRWTASTDNVSVTSYIVNRNGQPLITTTTPTTFHSDTKDTVADTAYTYMVAALDAAGNTSTLSSGVTTTTLATGTTDFQAPPTTPSNLTATATSATQITLNWSPSMDNVGVSGYTIYRATSASATPVNVGTSTTTTYIDTGLTSATAYFYVIRAFDGFPSESLNSGQASATTL